MFREAIASSEIHTSHCMSKRFRLKLEERIWNHVNDPVLTSKIEQIHNITKGVQ
jgi:hypothetical protein